jgi:phenolic acid decarboxylase
MVSDQGLYQLFLFDPNGVKVELNFAHEEAILHGIIAPVKASEL